MATGILEADDTHHEIRTNNVPSLKLYQSMLGSDDPGFLLGCFGLFIGASTAGFSSSTAVEIEGLAVLGLL